MKKELKKNFLVILGCILTISVSLFLYFFNNSNNWKIMEPFEFVNGSVLFELPNGLIYNQILSMEKTNNKSNKDLLSIYYECSNDDNTFSMEWLYQPNKPLGMTFEINKQIFLSQFPSAKNKGNTLANQEQTKNFEYLNFGDVNLNKDSSITFQHEPLSKWYLGINKKNKQKRFFLEAIIDDGYLTIEIREKEHSNILDEQFIDKFLESIIFQKSFIQ